MMKLESQGIEGKGRGEREGGRKGEGRGDKER
jgi:hypothetical protein